MNIILKLPDNLKILFDACSVINLVNGNQFNSVLSLAGYDFFIGPAVYNEVAEVEYQKKIIDDFIASGKIQLWEEEIGINLLSRLYSKYGLGDGETESITICIGSNLLFCCDDNKARNAGKVEFGETRVMGSLRLLKLAVSENIIKCNDAEFSYLEMKFKGGWLPKIDHAYFCKAL